MPPELSVVVPMYNEVTRLSAGVGTMAEYLNTTYADAELILVDDGSDDATFSEAQRLLEKYPNLQTKVLRLERNQGKGAAVRRGMQEAKGSVRLFADADNATPIEELSRLLPMVKTSRTVVIGSRALDPAKLEKRQPWWRQSLGKTFNWLLRSLMGLPFRDTQCGFKLFGREAAEFCFFHQKLDGFAFDVELLWLAKLADVEVNEVPVRWRHVEESRVNALWDSFRMLRDVLRVRMLHRSDKASLAKE